MFQLNLPRLVSIPNPIPRPDAVRIPARHPRQRNSRIHFAKEVKNPGPASGPTLSRKGLRPGGTSLQLGFLLVELTARRERGDQVFSIRITETMRRTCGRFHFEFPLRLHPEHAFETPTAPHPYRYLMWMHAYRHNSSAGFCDRSSRGIGNSNKGGRGPPVSRARSHRLFEPCRKTFPGTASVDSPAD